MNAIPDDKFLLKPSPLYFGEINGSNKLKLYDLMKPQLILEQEIEKLKKEIEKNKVGTCKLSSDDKNSKRFSTVVNCQNFLTTREFYQPLILPQEQSREKTLGGCLGNCILDEYGGLGAIGLEIGANLVLSGLTPKKILGLKKGTAGATPFTSCLSYLELQHPNLKKDLPPWMTRKSPRMSKKSAFRETKTVLKFAGRWIPILGWVLLASDVAMITYCTSNCMKDKKQLPPKNSDFMS